MQIKVSLLGVLIITNSTMEDIFFKFFKFKNKTLSNDIIVYRNVYIYACLQLAVL